MLRQKKTAHRAFPSYPLQPFGYTAKQTTAAKTIANHTQMHSWYTNGYASLVMQRFWLCMCEVIYVNALRNHQVKL